LRFRQATVQAEMGALAAQNASLLAQVEQLQAQMGAQAAASQEASQLQVCV
jgi:cell division protein FtsB